MGAAGTEVANEPVSIDHSLRPASLLHSKVAWMVTELSLPYPPSVNHYFSYYQGRPVLSKGCESLSPSCATNRDCQRDQTVPGLTAIRIDIAPPDDRRRDCDNVQKAVLDALQHAGAFWDDSQVVWLLVIKHGLSLMQSPGNDQRSE